MSKTLYQPVTADSINEDALILRNSQDRLDSMINFCQNRYKNSFSEKTFLDIGCCYGFFVNGFKDVCSKVMGIDYGDKEVRMSKIFYPNIANDIRQEDFTENIDDYDEYDIVAALSIMHGIIISDGLDFASEMLKKIDEKTKDVLFIDMGQEHEDEYKNSLSGWNQDSIQEWIKKETTFDVCEILITDSDPMFGRTLFACYRTAK